MSHKLKLHLSTCVISSRIEFQHLLTFVNMCPKFKDRISTHVNICEHVS